MGRRSHDVARPTSRAARDPGTADRVAATRSDLPEGDRHLRASYRDTVSGPIVELQVGSSRPRSLAATILGREARRGRERRSARPNRRPWPRPPSPASRSVWQCSKSPHSYAPPTPRPRALGIPAAARFPPRTHTPLDIYAFQCIILHCDEGPPPTTHPPACLRPHPPQSARASGSPPRGRDSRRRRRRCRATWPSWAF